jgi:hypothetical protein
MSLSKEQEAAYRAWMTKIGHTKAAGYKVDENGNGTDYDYRGFFQKYGPVDVAQGQHLTDEFKLPNHPTFSNESIYATGQNAARAGHWNGDTFVSAAPVNHTPAWLEWLKKPENLTTGLVLAAGLMQDRRPGQSKLDALGQVGLGTLAFRGGLQQGVQQTQERQQEQASQQGYRKDQTDIARDRNRIEQEEGAANRKAQADQTAATIQGQEHLRSVPQAQTPAETDYQRALAENARAQAALYGRMPVGPGDKSGKPEDAIGGDLYEEEMFKQWASAEMQNAQMSGQPFVMDPMKWMQYVQPYRNAKIVLKQMETQGLPGEIYKDDKGTYRVRITNVAPPTPSGDPNAPPAGNPPPVELTPGPSPTMQAPQNPEVVKMEAQVASGHAPDNARLLERARVETMARKMEGLDRLGLEKLLRAKDTDTALARAIRKRLAELNREETKSRLESYRKSKEK